MCCLAQNITIMRTRLMRHIILAATEGENKDENIDRDWLRFDRPHGLLLLRLGGIRGSTNGEAFECSDGRRRKRWIRKRNMSCDSIRRTSPSPANIAISGQESVPGAADPNAIICFPQYQRRRPLPMERSLKSAVRAAPMENTLPASVIVWLRSCGS